MSFQRPARRVVDPAALERFATGADERRAAMGADAVSEKPVEAATPQPSPAPVPVPTSVPAKADAAGPEKTQPVGSTPVQAPAVPARKVAVPVKQVEVAARQSEGILWRMTPETQALLKFVYENTNVKSQQKLIDAIMLPELERRAAEIKGQR